MTSPAVHYEAHGASVIPFLWLIGRERPPLEVMVVGPAGTGKSLGIGQFLLAFMDRYADAQILCLRKTRVSLNESFLDTWENEVLGPGHEAIADLTRAHRRDYVLGNGARMVLGGMDRPRRLFSTQYHIIYACEMTEFTEAEWMSLHRGLRRPGAAGWTLLIGDANPDSEFHWANRRFPDPAPFGRRRAKRNGRMRILSWHSDNPTITPEYLRRMDTQNVGHMRDRLYLGLWRTASGLVYQGYSQFVHLQAGRLRWTRDAFGKPIRGEPVTLELPALEAQTTLTWFGASLDFGFVAPGCMQVWGVDQEERAYRCAEVYQTGKDVEWWADYVADLWFEFRFRFLVCDNDEEKVKRINDHLSKRGVPRLAKCVSKPQHKETMFNAVRELLKPRRDGFPGIYLLRDVLRGGRDPALDGVNKPCCLEEELVGLVIRKPRDTAEGEVMYEESEPTCADHAADAMGYFMLEAWGKDLSKRETPLERLGDRTHRELLESAHDLMMRERRTQARKKGGL